MTKISKTFVGIDNGVTGSVGIIYSDGTSTFIPTPVYKTQSYTQKEQFIHRIKWEELLNILPPKAFVLIERPMVDPHRFIATASALRSLEATLIVLEMLGLEYTYIDSKEWQGEFLSSSNLGHDALKEASICVAINKFPCLKEEIVKHKDGDGILIAEYARIKYGNV